jgi:hypothetical protein
MIQCTGLALDLYNYIGASGHTLYNNVATYLGVTATAYHHRHNYTPKMSNLSEVRNSYHLRNGSMKGRLLAARPRLLATP